MLIEATFSPSSPDQCPDVSVIIVNWNTRQVLRDCLNSIVAQTTASIEIIVIDNASTDGSSQMVQAEFSAVQLITNNQNRGFAAANNQGLKIARGRNVLLLNPDTVILDNAIDKMLTWLRQHPKVGCAGCQVLESPTAIQRTCFADPGPLNLMLVEFGLLQFAHRVKFFGRPWYGDWDRKTERNVDVISGMFMLLPRHVFQKVGFLDEAFFVYAEEADWCRRIREKGFQCVFTPTAKILHLERGSQSTKQVSFRMHIQKQKSHLIYMRKHRGIFGYLFARAVYLVSSMLRYLIFGCIRLVTDSKAIDLRAKLASASLVYHVTGRGPNA